MVDQGESGEIVNDASAGPSRSAMVARLVALDYGESDSARLAERLLLLSPELAQALLTWLRTGQLPPVERHGFSATRLESQFGMNPVATLLTLDDLEREPEATLRGLARGIDRVRSTDPDEDIEKSR
jgi:hypothetical protein